MDHPQIHMIRLQARKQIFKSRLYLIQLSCFYILAVLPGGTDMSLDDPFLPPSLQRKPDIGADIRLGHPAVQNIDPFFFTGIDHLFYLFRVMPLQPLCPQTDLAHLKSRFSQCSVPHFLLLPCAPAAQNTFFLLQKKRNPEAFMPGFTLSVAQNGAKPEPPGSASRRQMQEMGLEPTHSHLRQILSLMRLPFRHSCLSVISEIPVSWSGIFLRRD